MENNDQGATTATVAPPSTAPSDVEYYASIYPAQNEPVPPEMCILVKRLERLLGAQVWMLIQDGRENWGNIDYPVFKAFLDSRNEIDADRPVAILIESPGGIANHAYHIARLFQRRASKFIAIVPLYAKSAATLLALGGSELILGNDAELGPLDVQLLDREREDFGSALDAVQSLELTEPSGHFFAGGAS